MSRSPLSWKPIVWGCGVLAALGLAHGAVWLATVDRLAVLLRVPSGMLLEWDQRKALGSARPVGWPSRAGLEIGPASITTGGFAWRAERVTASTPLRWPGMNAGPIDVTPTGQRVRFGSGVQHVVTARHWIVEVLGDDVQLQSLDLDVAGLFGTQALQLWLGPWGLTASARHLRLSGAAVGPGLLVNTLVLHAVLTQPVPHPESLRSSAFAWQAAAGVADVSEFSLITGNTRVSGSGRAWLDAALQPRLDGVVHITGYAAGLDELVAAGFVAAQTAVAAKAILGLLAASSPDGGADVPVRIADGILTVAQFPLKQLPLLEWSNPVLGQ